MDGIKCTKCRIVKAGTATIGLLEECVAFESFDRFSGHLVTVRPVVGLVVEAMWMSIGCFELLRLLVKERKQPERQGIVRGTSNGLGSKKDTAEALREARRR